MNAFPLSPLRDYYVARLMANSAREAGVYGSRSPEWDRLCDLAEACYESLMVRMDAYSTPPPVRSVRYDKESGAYVPIAARVAS